MGRNPSNHVIINFLLFFFSLSVGVIFITNFLPSLLSSPILLVLSNGSSNNNVVVRMKEESSLMHNMSDKEVFWRAKSMVPRKGKMLVSNNNKVAFMFLTPGPLLLAPLWEKFFEGHQGFYSIYVHPHPSYNDTILLPQSSVFYGRRIPSQVSFLLDANKIIQFLFGNVHCLVFANNERKISNFYQWVTLYLQKWKRGN